MFSSLTLDSASHLLTWSNAIYVVGAVLTLSSAGMVLYEKRSRSLGLDVKWGLTTEVVVIIAALISLLGTIGAIYFGGRVSHFKDVALSTFQSDSQVKIAQANAKSEQAKADAAVANQKAQQAQDDAAEVESENLKLGGTVGANEARAKAAEAALEVRNKETSDYAHAVATQQQNMAQQAKVSPVLDQGQIASLAGRLRAFRGQSVTVHMTLDTVVLRLGNGIQAALNDAGITPAGVMDAGSTYQGVSVVVHSPQEVPPLANALVLGLRAQGITVTPAAENSVPAGQVALYLGPN